MFQVRTLLCAIALASVANAVVYRPNNNMVYQRRQDASATAMAQAASTSKPSPPFNFGNPSSDYPGVVADGRMRVWPRSTALTIGVRLVLLISTCLYLIKKSEQWLGVQSRVTMRVLFLTVPSPLFTL